MASTSTVDRIIHGGRVIAAFAMGGAVMAGLSIGWIPALALVDVHAIGAALGGIAGIIVNARHLV